MLDSGKIYREASEDLTDTISCYQYDVVFVVYLFAYIIILIDRSINLN